MSTSPVLASKKHVGICPSSEQIEIGDTAIINSLQQYDEGETRRILRKVDWRVVPCLTIMYLIAFIDRANIGNAKVAGMNEDLELSGTQYNIALTIFFIPYALLEVPCNIVLKLTRPCIWLPSIMLAWGVVLTLMGIVTDFKGLIISRLFLGITEAGFFPGATYLLTIWYRRYEVQTRMVAFYAGASLSGAFSGLLAYGIQHMDGIGGLAGWKWIFILEGIATVVVAISIYWLLPDSPETASFLTAEERHLLVNRLENETGTSEGKVTNNDKMSLRQVIDALKDFRIYLAVIIYWGNSIGVYAFSFTIPTVIRELGYSAANAQLLTIPIYVLAMVCATITAIWSDRAQQRSFFIMGACVVASLGFIALVASPRPGFPGLTYGFLFLASSGLYSFIIPTICWIGNNLSPSSRRAVGMAALISGGNLGGIIGSNIFLESEKPRYSTGYGVCLATVVAAGLAAVVLCHLYKRDNIAREKLTLEAVREKWTEAQLIQLGDRSPLFRYSL